MPTQAEQRIEFIYAFLEDPAGLCKESWEDWSPLIANARAQVTDEDLRKKATESINFFNDYFYKKTE